MNIFDLIKNNSIEKLTELINNDDKINLNVKDESDNFFIHYVILSNNIELFKLCLKKNVRLNCMDSDDKSILYIPLKFNYIEIIKLCLEYNNKIVGSSLIGIKDGVGLTSLHYSILFNNFMGFKLLLDNKASPYIYDNNNNDCIHYTIIHNRVNMMEYFIKNNYRMNIYSIRNESLLQFALNHQNYDIFHKLLKTSIDLNHQDEDGIALIHQCVIMNNIGVYNTLLDLNVNVNVQDYYGNTILHYICIEKYYSFLERLTAINYDYSNFNGDIALHILLNNMDIEDKYIVKIIMNSNLNIQNNQGITCLMLLYRKKLLDKFYDILVNKSLNFFIQDNEKNSIKLDDNIIKLIIDSYYNQLLKHKDILQVDWEKWCGNNNLDELIKHGSKKNVKIENICKDKIKDIILKEHRSLPMLHNYNLILDNGIFINTCYYTGFPIDILFGLLLLSNTFPDLESVLDYPLTINKNLEDYYKKIGINYQSKTDFYNIEIVWSYQSIFYPSYFDNEIIKKISQKKKYIVIPIGIELSVGSHANILFWDINNKIIERFEPHGANCPLGFNYNAQLLDSLLETKFKQFDKNIIYLPPKKFSPIIGFQMLENFESEKCKRIGDPNGFCGVWCIWWIYQRMLNIDKPEINIYNIYEELIKYIKFDGLKFKNIIRNFSSKITLIRDKYLDKYKLDINDWINGNYDTSDIDNLEKDIFKSI